MARHNPDAFRGFSPTGKVPCLVDGNITVWDSLAITEYVGERHAGVWPAEAAARAWARCASAEMHSGFFALRNACTMNCGIRVTLRSIDAPLKRDLARLEELWADGIGRFGGPFLTGARFCAVDAFFAPVAFRIQTYNRRSTRRAALCRALLALPAMQTGTRRHCRKPGATRSTRPKRAPWASGTPTCAQAPS